MNFYMIADDEKNFVDFVTRDGDAVLLPYTSSTPEFEPVVTLPKPLSGKWWGSFWIYNRKISTELPTVFIPQQGYYLIDDARAFVIEFSRSFLKEEDQTLHRGRIHADFAYPDLKKKVMVTKDSLFERWYETVAGWIRRNFERVDKLIYTGPRAKYLHDSGIPYDVEVIPKPEARKKSN